MVVNENPNQEVSTEPMPMIKEKVMLKKLNHDLLPKILISSGPPSNRGPLSNKGPKSSQRYNESIKSTQFSMIKTPIVRPKK